MSSSSEFSLFCSGCVFKAFWEEIFGFHFNPMEMFPLFLIQCVPKRDSDGLVYSQNQLTSVLSKHIRASGVIARVTLTICFDSSAPKVPKAPLRGIRNRGNHSPSGLCVCLCVCERLWKPLSFDWHDSLPDWTHSQQQSALIDSTAEQEAENNTHTYIWMKAGSCEASLHFSR